MAEICAGTVRDFDDGGRVVVRLGKRSIVVLRHRDEYYALDNTCRHMGGPVGEGMIIPKVDIVLTEDGCAVGQRFSDDEIHIVCPWHGYEYDISTGRQAGDDSIALRTYGTDQRGESIYVVD